MLWDLNLKIKKIHFKSEIPNLLLLQPFDNFLDF